MTPTDARKKPESRTQHPDIREDDKPYALQRHRIYTQGVMTPQFPADVFVARHRGDRPDN